MYVLVLGLDVLGNPFGLVRGLAEGLEDLFYEPYQVTWVSTNNKTKLLIWALEINVTLFSQGAIQGPEEFAEGLALGVRSLLGHAVGEYPKIKPYTIRFGSLCHLIKTSQKTNIHPC